MAAIEALEAALEQLRSLGTGLTFKQLADQNRSRVERWHPGFPEEQGSADWNGADWSNALAGETGELCNVVKKLRRIETGHQATTDAANRGIFKDELMRMLADEIGDVATYLDLVAQKYGLDLSECVVSKFNKISKRMGYPERLLATIHEAPPLDHGAHNHDTVLADAVEDMHGFRPEMPAVHVTATTLDGDITGWTTYEDGRHVPDSTGIVPGSVEFKPVEL